MADTNLTYVIANFACLHGYGNDVGVVVSLLFCFQALAERVNAKFLSCLY